MAAFSVPSQSTHIPAFPSGVIVGAAVAKTTGSFQFSSESQITTAQDKKLSAKTLLFDSVRDQCKDIAHTHSENVYADAANDNLHVLGRSSGPALALENKS